MERNEAVANLTKFEKALQAPKHTSNWNVKLTKMEFSDLIERNQTAQQWKKVQQRAVLLNADLTINLLR